MPITMSVSQESLKGFQPVPEGLYEVRFEGFKFKHSKDGKSVNLNPSFKIVAGPQGWKPSASGRGDMLFGRINTLAAWILQDFSHAFGFPLEKKQDGGMGLVGDIDGTDGNDATTWTYRGPLTGKVGKVYAIQGSYNGKPNNEIKYYVCAVPDCNKRFPDVTHSTDLLRK